MMNYGGFLTDINAFLADAGNIYLFIALTGTVIFLLSFIFSMFGMGADVDVDADFTVEMSDLSDISGLNFFSLKAIIAFITFFGWGGFFFGHYGWGGLAIAIGCGVIMMFLTALVLSLLLKLQHSGNVTTAELVGKRATVYLSIPAERSAGGLVTVTLSGGTRQIGARADEELKTGTAVTVAEDLGDGSVLVVKA